MNTATIVLVGSIIERFNRRIVLVMTLMASLVIAPIIYVVLVDGIYGYLDGFIYIYYAYAGLLYGTYIKHRGSFTLAHRVVLYAVSAALLNSIFVIATRSHYYAYSMNCPE